MLRIPSLTTPRSTWSSAATCAILRGRDIWRPHIQPASPQAAGFLLPTVARDWWDISGRSPPSSPPDVNGNVPA